MSRNNLYVGRHLTDHLLDAIDHSIDAAARVHIDERKPIRYEVISHVHNIRLRKEDDRISIRMTRRKVERANILAIQMYGDIMIKGDDRQRILRRGLRLEFHRSAIPSRAARLQPLAYIVMRNNRCLLLKIRISAGM